ncbi:hypothetical protein DOTSEDRAFT_69013 [Lecanosticta acicola]|uniref:Synaptobrevin n=1 Tax=Lecanosticta acicola TaxID=111012 RepID=A0AAI8Z2F7_9PEZI|nr:hypothetical protein DOTSEDRAFT_69013 [Lecanosticta acicola]
MATTISLNRLLNRLDQNLSDPESDYRLQHSQYERSRVAANIEHARAMLLTLEKQSATVKVQLERQKLQADLQAKREVIKRLNAKLRELNDTAADEDEDEDDDEEQGGENVLNTYAPAREDADAGIESGHLQEKRIDETQAQELRSRKAPLQASDNRSAASTTARDQLFSQRPKEPPPSSSLPQTETLMSHNRTEQENLTTGLLGLAQALKESSITFGQSLESEKEVMKRAEGGLDKNAQGMQAAEKKMGTLRRMSEGQGWWGRLKLYGFIFGLWVACFLLVFLGPKLRF